MNYCCDDGLYVQVPPNDSHQPPFSLSDYIASLAGEPSQLQASTVPSAIVTPTEVALDSHYLGKSSQMAPAPYYGPSLKKYTKGNIPGEYLCKECSYSSYNKTLLKKHIMSRHRSDKPLKCSYPGCNYAANFKSVLDRHAAKHSQTKSYKCPQCNFGSAYKEALSDHITVKHRKDRVFSCTLCEFSSSFHAAYVRHCKVKHSDERPFECSQCNFSAAYQSALNRHVKTKHTEKRFHCDLCMYKSVFERELKRHRKAAHKDLPL